MDVKIDKRGNLYFSRKGIWTLQKCPFKKQIFQEDFISNGCSNRCPLFEIKSNYNKESRDSCGWKELHLCFNKKYYINELIDERYEKIKNE